MSEKTVFDEWLATRPPVIQQLGQRFPPWKWWHLDTDDHEMSVYQVVGYWENGTLTVVCYNVATGKAMWQVFGINPDDLVATRSLDELQAGLTPEEKLAGQRHYTVCMRRLAAAKQREHN